MKTLFKGLLPLVFLGVLSAEAMMSSSSSEGMRMPSSNKPSRDLLSVQHYTGFFHLGSGIQFDPLNEFAWHDFVVDLQFGGYIGKNGFFSAGVRGGGHTPSLNLKYGFDFVKGYRWIPGWDVSLLVGHDKRQRVTRLVGAPPAKLANETDADYSKRAAAHNAAQNAAPAPEPRKIALAAGFELGVYLKSFISKSHALLLRTGITHDTAQRLSEFAFADSKMYLSLAMQWHF